MDIDQPEFFFISNYPEVVNSTPPLASSIQHFEACLMLIGYQRYPNALISCVSAIESAFKAASIEEKYTKTTGRKPTNDKESQATLLQCLDYAQKKFPQFAKFTKSELFDFKEKRNQITHYGYSTKDDHESFVLLSTIGIKYLEQLYSSYFGFSLLGTNSKNGLMIEPFNILLRACLECVSTSSKENISNDTISPLSFAVRQHFGRLESWRLIVEEENQESIWEAKEEVKKILLNKLEPSFEFDCPICSSSDSFIAKLDEGKLDSALVAINSGMCFECNFKSSNENILSKILSKEIVIKTPVILKEYGIKK